MYDVFDRRIAKDVDDDGGGTIDRGERYVYDGTNIALVYDRSDNLVERLLYGPGVDQPLASEDGSGDVLWFLTDNQGTIRDVAEYDGVSGDSTVVNHITYGGFGNITSQSNAAFEPRHTYTGREWDADSELFYYRARWYDPAVGRFISEDPLSFGGADANLSRYVGNAATNFTDPTGLWGVPVIQDGTNLLDLTIRPDIQALMESMRYTGPVAAPPEDMLGRTQRYFGYVAEVGSMLPGAETVRDVGELMLGRDIHGNPLTGFDYTLTAAGLLLPVSGAWLRRMAHADDIAQGAVRLGDDAADIAGDGVRQVDPLPILNQPPPNCFVAGTLVLTDSAVDSGMRIEYAVGSLLVILILLGENPAKRRSTSGRGRRRRRQDAPEIWNCGPGSTFPVIPDAASTRHATLGAQLHEEHHWQVSERPPRSLGGDTTYTSAESTTDLATPSANRPPASLTRTLLGLRAAAVALSLLLATVLGGFGLLAPSPTKMQPIERIELGQRVVADNPHREETTAPAKSDPLTWRTVQLELWHHGVRYDINLLRPFSWLQQQQARVGGRIDLALEEIGVAGSATVLNIKPCPTIEPTDATNRQVVNRHHRPSG